MRSTRQTNQPQLRQVLQPLFSLRKTVWPLAASWQMLDETVPNVALDLTVGAGGVPEGKVVHPTLQVSVQLSDQYRNWLMALMTVRHSVQFLPLSLECLDRRKHIQVFPIASFPVAVVPKRIPQKGQT